MLHSHRTGSCRRRGRKDRRARRHLQHRARRASDGRRCRRGYWRPTGSRPAPFRCQAQGSRWASRQTAGSRFASARAGSHDRRMTANLLPTPPNRECLAVEAHSLPGDDLRLPVIGQVASEAVADDFGDQPRRGDPAIRRSGGPAGMAARGRSPAWPAGRPCGRIYRGPGGCAGIRHACSRAARALPRRCAAIAPGLPAPLADRGPAR